MDDALTSHEASQEAHLLTWLQIVWARLACQVAGWGGTAPATLVGDLAGDLTGEPEDVSLPATSSWMAAASPSSCAIILEAQPALC